MFIPILLILILIFDYFHSRSKELEKRHGLVQTIFTIIALIVALNSFFISKEAIDSSNRATNTTIRILDSISQSSSKLNESLNSVSEKLKLIPGQIDTFSTSVDSLNNKFKTIILATATQLQIMKKQHELIEKEYNRKPEYEIFFKESSVDQNKLLFNSIRIMNKGNILANILNLKIILPNDVANLKIMEGDFIKFPSLDNNIVVYTLNMGKYDNNKITLLPGPFNEFKFNLEYTFSANKKNFPFQFVIFYESRYEDGLKYIQMQNLNRIFTNAPEDYMSTTLNNMYKSSKLMNRN